MPSFWPFLAATIGRSPCASVSHSDLDAHGADAEELLAAGLLHRIPIEDRWSPPECPHNCVPGFDFDTRAAEGYVGVWCRTEVGCTGMRDWHHVRDMQMYQCAARPAADAFRKLHRLPVIQNPSASVQITPLGVLHKRGLVVPVVVLDHFVSAVEETCQGIRVRLGGDGLIVLMTRPPERTSFRAHDRIVLWTLRADRSGDLGLARALDELDPTWKARRLTETNAIFDGVRITFATEPGRRHGVTLDGREISGFHRSDLKFLRLLRLALAVRDDAAAEGWLPKHALGGNEHDHDLVELRAELKKGDHPTLSAADRGGLIKRHDEYDGRVRLALEAQNISIDVAGFRLLTEEIKVPKGSSATVKRRAAEVNVGVATARKLWREIERRIGGGAPLHDAGLTATT